MPNWYLFFCFPFISSVGFRHAGWFSTLLIKIMIKFKHWHLNFILICIWFAWQSEQFQVLVLLSPKNLLCCLLISIFIFCTQNKTQTQKKTKLKHLDWKKNSLNLFSRVQKKLFIIASSWWLNTYGRLEQKIYSELLLKKFSNFQRFG